ncbi:co(2)-response secreted protease [Phtheirospermum japonicum]|uniref:Co(2)-response secreted protease n=1 Tax=Phtheirospermum japonicum TaxID=374723 RepID=A0A830CET1_9LAMI|nr:co(2)-response secreted protease [Phtheirospermum japonicum]
MRGLFHFCGFNILLIVSFLGEANTNKVYIVYMGASPIGAPTNYHAQLMSELMKRKKNPVVHTYNKSFVGFAARLSEEEAKSIARRPGVVSVFPDRVLQLQTTRSKVIGARYYVDPDETGYIVTPRDEDGHGTHVASTAAGRHVWGGASYYGLAQGIPRGGSPCSRIAMYRVCGYGGGCQGAGVLKAFDDAIADGVDVISISLAHLPGETDFTTDPIAIGSFHSVEKGITVVASAGNSGSASKTVVNVAPWILTVAATTIDRDFVADVVLGGNIKVIKGGGINFSGLRKSAVYPLTDGFSAANQKDVDYAKYCVPGLLDDDKVKGKIVVCENKYPRGTIKRFDALKKQGAIGMLVIDNHISDSSRAFPGKEPPLFNIDSGTSMACPHVSGLAATVKSHHPTWSPSAIRSAIMTTAIQTNNLHAPITTNNGSRATPYDMGAGEISTFGPLCPGLVYETKTIDYIQFLCNFGYNTSVIRTIASTVPNNFSCPSISSPDLISDMNYPSIAVSGLKENGSRTVKRTVTNVGEAYSTYMATVEAPVGVLVQVVPKTLRFTKNANRLSFQVTFTRTTTTSHEELFGSITWCNWKYKVRSPFVVSKG